MEREGRLLRFLDDAVAMEAGLIPALQDMADAATCDDDRAMFLRHLEVTRRQHDRLAQRLKELRGEPSGVKSVIAKLSVIVPDLGDGGREQEEREVRALIAAYGSAHVEIATYWALEMAASTVGDTQTAQLARDHRAEEEASAREVHACLLARSAGAMDAAGSR